MKITVAGVGYVGLSLAVLLALFKMMKLKDFLKKPVKAKDN